MDPIWILIPVFVAVMVGTLWLGWRDDLRKREKHELDMKVRQDERALLAQATSFKIGNREYIVHREESRSEKIRAAAANEGMFS